MRETLTVIDGESFYHMMTALQVRCVAAEAFFRFLQSLAMGGCRSSCRPTITMLPQTADSIVGMKYRERGFEVISCTSKGEKDDLILEEMILSARPEKIASIIIVSTDGERFIRPLREKKQQGILVLWAAADIVSAQGSPAIGENLRKCFLGTPPEFKFINITKQIPRWDLTLHPLKNTERQRVNRISIR